MSFRTRVPEADLVRPRRRAIITNSNTIKFGDAIKLPLGFASAVSAVTDPIAGIVTAFLSSQGIAYESHAAPTGAFDGTYTTSTRSYAAASNNQTVAGVMVEYIPVREGDQLYANLSAAKGTTTGSNKEGYYLSINTADAGQLLESSASQTITNTQFMIRDGLVGDSDTTKVVVEVHNRLAD